MLNTLLQMSKTIKNLSGRVRKLEAQPIGFTSYWKEAVTPFLLLPSLRGFWPMSSLDNSGNAIDLSGQSRTLTYAGNPVYGNNGFAPYIEFDGTGDNLSRADEAGLDIVGTESYVASSLRGLTIGGWFWFDSYVTARLMMSKWRVTASNNRSYRTYWSNTDGKFKFDISTDGTAVTSVVGDSDCVIGQRYFIVGKFVPSTEMAIFVNGTKAQNLVSIPATIYSGNGDFYIGTQDAGSTFMMDGGASLCFLCASALPDELINALFHQTRGLFGL